MRETLRLAPTAPGRSVAALEDTVVGGKYAIPKDTPVLISIYSVHRDPKVWGEDVNEFLPERMLGDKFDKLPVRRHIRFTACYTPNLTFLEA